jgi:PIN domain nuclease of toxin-antitoxin system
MATAQGTVIFDFGAVPGTNIVTTVVPSATISAASKVEVYLMGTDSTATHNAIEHQLLPLLGLSLTPISVTAGVGFTAQAATLARLTGTFTARWVWAD